MSMINARLKVARRARIWSMALVAAILGCSSDSFLVVKMVAPTGTTVPRVAFIAVTAKNASGRMSPVLQFNTHRLTDGTPLEVTLDDAVGKDFSLQFSSSERGPVDLVVSAFSASCGCVAEGVLEKTPLNHGGTANATMIMSTTSTCTNTCPTPGTGGSGGGQATGGRGGAAGTGGAGGAMTFPGCDPASPTACATGQTCFVDCDNKQGVCVQGGTTGPGGRCSGNEDCMAGTQCFDYSGLGCNVGVCLAFCGSDAQCTSRIGNGSACVDQVECKSGATSYRTCTSNCDPVGAATNGCPQGLNCFLFTNPAGGEDVADCSCAGSARTKGDGDPCATSNDCKAGLVCHVVGASQICRPLCKRNSSDCGAGKSCQMVMRSTTYGVCLTGGATQN